jgi:lysyl-tRNA synthetase class II
MIVKYRNTQIDTDAMANYTEQEFREAFKGIVDLETVCKELNKYFKKDVQKTEKTSGKRKKSKSEDTTQDSI